MIKYVFALDLYLIFELLLYSLLHSKTNSFTTSISDKFDELQLQIPK